MSEPHLETHHGEQSGRDPREMTVAELNGLGHDKMPLLKAIRAKCLDCCGGQQSEVRRCVSAKTCSLWPYRMNSNPFSEREGNPAGAAALIAWRERQQADSAQ